MRLLRPTTEDDMVATFLRAEIASERFGAPIEALLRRDGKARAVVEAPDITDPDANAYRRRLLGECRGYGRDRDVFAGWPASVAWFRATLSPHEVARLRYVEYSYWNALSGGSRLAGDAAEAIRAGREVYEQRNERFLRAAGALRQGVRFPELIVAGGSAEGPLTVLEGNLRLTAYLLVPECLPEALEVVAGFAAELAGW
jgi:hypothetical protein